MKLAQGDSESGIVIGNTFDKYGSTNPIARRMVGGFDSALWELIKQSGAKTVHEVGCGEGYWTIRMTQSGWKARGSDFSEKVIRIARENAANAAVEVPFVARSIYDLKPKEDDAPLVVCCEVMEHLDNPHRALEVLAQIANPFLIASVPREPLWRVLNITRGKYWSDLGNTPGHLQHWSKRSFVNFLQSRFQIVEIRNPLPWTMVLCRRRES